MNFGTSQQSAQSKSVTGLRGTGYEGQAAEQAYKQGMNLSNLSNTLTSSPDAMMNYGRLMLPGGKFGFGENADAGVEQYGNLMFNKASGSGAARGQNSPEAMNSIIGSAITNSLPFLIPQLQATQYAQFKAPQDLMQTAKVSADYWSRVLGGQSDASSSGSGFQFGIDPSKLALTGGTGSTGTTG